jgi:hypothetical protein
LIDMTITRRHALLGLATLAPAVSTLASGAEESSDLRAEYRRWQESLPTAPPPVLKRHGLVAKELGRWHVIEANQAAAVDATHFYGIGNHVLVRHRKDTGERVGEWISPRGGPIVHYNAGFVDGHKLVLAHSNFPQLPPASSLETHDTQPRRATGIADMGRATSALLVGLLRVLQRHGHDAGLRSTLHVHR